MGTDDGLGKYDWVKITKDFLKSDFSSVKAYAEWCDVERKKGKDLPSKSYVIVAGKKYHWSRLKREKELRVLEKYVDGSVANSDPELIEKLKESAMMKTNLTKALVSLVIQFAQNPERLQVRANLSDIVNDAKRALNMRTKEQDMQAAPNIHVNQGVIGLDSRRRQLEEGSDEDVVKLESKSKSVNKQLKQKYFSDESEDAEILEVSDLKEEEISGDGQGADKESGN
jgi:hypothetical protein